MSELNMVLAELEREVFLFEGTAPGSGNIELKEEIFEENTSDGKSKVIVQKVLRPSIIPFIPEKCNGMAVIVMPGGAFRRMVINKEGVDIARWLNSKGIAAFVLKYRQTIDPHERQEDVSLTDTIRAIRHVRYHAHEFGIAPDRIGVMGFSAGGYLAALVSTCYGRTIYEPLDAIDAISARPDFSVLCYPAISAEVAIMDMIAKNPALVKIGSDIMNGENTSIANMNGTSADGASADGANLSGANTDMLRFVPESLRYRAKIFQKYSIEKLVHKDVPKTFILGTSDDDTTPIEHCISYYTALRKCGIPAEMHIFENGKHGFGLGREMEMEKMEKETETARVENGISEVANSVEVAAKGSDAGTEKADEMATVAAWPELFMRWAGSKGLI